MANEIKQDVLKIIEQCQVAPPPSSLHSTTLPLTFFDIAWFNCHHINRIFFYEFPHPTHHFLQTALPILKHSLSLTLQQFFPFSSNLIVPPQPHLSHIRYLDGDSLSFTVAESTADFTLLASHSPQHVQNLYPLIPTLSPPRVEQDGTRVFPLMAIQVTILPNSGFTICLTFNHVAADGKSLHHFIKFWASVCKAKGNMELAYLEASLSLPSHERDKVKDPKGLKLIYFQAVEHRLNEMKSMQLPKLVRDVSTKVRFTVALSLEQVDKLKKWVSLKCAETLHISTFVVTCSLFWVCMVISEENKDKDNCVEQHSNELCYLYFPADVRDSPEISLPSTYFGNCLALFIVGIKRSELLGENGIVAAANAIGKQIKDLKSDALRNAETLVPDFEKTIGKFVLGVAGSPKLGAYETDFGWGKPKKSEVPHIESSRTICLSYCRDEKGGIEVGSTLERIQMMSSSSTTKLVHFPQQLFLSLSLIFHGSTVTPSNASSSTTFLTPHTTFFKQHFPFSNTLQHFFPFSSNLIVPPKLNLSHIRYLDGDSLSFTVAESTADFTLLTSDSPQHVQNWHPLVPTLSPPRMEHDDTRVLPLMAIQVTVLPNSGFTICLTFNHIVGDGKSLHHFIKFWASVCKAKGNMNLAFLESSLSLPSHERDKVKDSKGLKLIYFQQLQHLESINMKLATIMPHTFTNKVRSTLVLSREQVTMLKKWVSLNCVTNDSGVLHISTFVVTCSLIWVCMIKAEERKDNCVAQDCDELCYMVFLADIRESSRVSLPSTYFGNCLASCIVGIKRSELVGENGIIEVAKAIERSVRDLKNDALTNAETLMSDYKELWKPSKSVVVIAGSPKLTVYDTDFGWGKPTKSDAVHIDVSGMISLSDCRDKEGGIEVGIALEKIRMNNFTNILEDQLMIFEN